ncbi:hypothetical protein IBT52_26970, partial [Bacillus sp. S72]|uniref:hypothetical protein n=1 Tax=Bacillus sp. S72 TaxID=2770969 RepID=UPI00190D5DB0
ALNRPAQVRQLNLADGTQTVLKQTPVEGPFDADAYASRRIWASSGDGTQVTLEPNVKLGKAKIHSPALE